jgi:hypothetical protein
MAEQTEATKMRATESFTGVGALRSGTVQFTVKEGISAESVHSMLDRLFDLHGCTVCGLVGLDVLIRGQDRLIFEKFQGIDGMQDVTILR